MNGIKANAGMRVEQEVDIVLRKLQLKIFSQPSEGVLLTTDMRHKHYKANENRIVLKDGILLPKNYRETDSVTYYQVLIPKQLHIQ